MKRRIHPKRTAAMKRRSAFINAVKAAVGREVSDFTHSGSAQWPSGEMMQRGLIVANRLNALLGGLDTSSRNQLKPMIPDKAMLLGGSL